MNIKYLKRQNFQKINLYKMVYFNCFKNKKKVKNKIFNFFTKTINLIKK